MTAMPAVSRRDLLKAGGALVVSFTLDAVWPSHAQTAATLTTGLGKTADANEVDGFLAVHHLQRKGGSRHRVPNRRAPDGG